jgi:rhodanese-related sulfurtransferase
MKNQQLNIIAILFFAVIVVAVAFCVITSKDYKVSNARLTENIQSKSFFNYAQLNTLLNSGEASEYLLVDLRTSEDYLKEHLPGAINIPYDELLERNHQKTISEKPHVLLYSEAEHTTAAAQFLLMGQGINNVLMIPGDFNSISQYVIEDYSPARAFYSEDKARFDYRRFMDVRATGPSHESPSTPAIPEVEDSPPVVGGC